MFEWLGTDMAKLLKLQSFAILYPNQPNQHNKPKELYI